MADVKFTLDGDAAKAVRAFLALQNAESQAGEGMKELAHISDGTTRTMAQNAKHLAAEYEKAAASLRGGGLSFSHSAGRAVAARAASVRAAAGKVDPDEGGGFMLGVGSLLKANVVTAAAHAAIRFGKEFLDEKEEREKDLAGAGVAFEKEMRPLLGIGENYTRAGALRSQVLNVANAYSLPTAQVVEGLRELQTAGGNLSRGMRDELFKSSLQLAQLMGGDLAGNINLVSKMIDNYGSEAGGAAKITSQLAYGYEHAGSGAESFNEIMVKLAPVAKFSGTSLAELIAINDTATHVLGKSKEAQAAFNDTLQKFPEALKLGIVQGGTAIDIIEQLGRAAAASDPMFQKLFGEKDSARLSALAAHVDQMRKDKEAIDKVPSNLIDTRVARAWADNNVAGTNVVAAIRSATENVDKGISPNRGAIRDRAKVELSLLGAHLRNPATPDFINTGLAKADYWTGGMLGYSAAGAKEAYDAARAVGNKQLQERLRVEFGKQLGLFYRDAQGNKVFTNADDANKLGRLRAQGFDLSLDQYLRLRSLQSDVAGGAAFFTSPNNTPEYGGPHIGKFAAGTPTSWLLNLNHNRDELDDLHKRGFKLSDQEYMRFKDMGLDSQENAYKFLGTHAGNAEASAYAAQKSKEASEKIDSASTSMTAAAASLERSAKSMEMSTASMAELLGNSGRLPPAQKNPDNHR